MNMLVCVLTTVQKRGAWKILFRILMKIIKLQHTYLVDLCLTLLEFADQTKFHKHLLYKPTKLKMGCFSAILINLFIYLFILVPMKIVLKQNLRLCNIIFLLFLSSFFLGKCLHVI